VGGNSSGASIILHYNGKTWSTMTGSVPANLFLKVWGTSAANVFAVDSQGNIVHYDGKVWSKMNGSAAGELDGIWGSSANDVFLVGANGTILNYAGN
jgi:hypothetical protein